MAAIKSPTPVLLLLAAFSEKEDALAWARGKAMDEFGPLARESVAFAFVETAYYEPSMGGPLIKRFFAFERLIDPAALAEIKCLTNDWEREYAEQLREWTPDDLVPRPLNLDPGYIELGKLVLASTKNHSHRIYLGRGIYAEVTLQYRLNVGWQPQPWTFPDYRRADYHEFFAACREDLHARLKANENLSRGN